MDFHTHPPPSRVKFFTGPLEWNFPQPSCITGAFCLWLELRPPGGKFIASSRCGNTAGEQYTYFEWLSHCDLRQLSSCPTVQLSIWLTDHPPWAWDT
uniref:HDC09186 n=1 Tax=Drosophila melanogaster TaxID=7227 RepID=Q6ILK6_DROME|nr:TPA_inf: HDC09186 [Drosophila melanogaster]